MEEPTSLPLSVAGCVRLGDRQLDLASEQLRAADGKQIELRPQAFAVLRHLALNAGRVVTKDELFAAVWPGLVVTDDSLVQAIGDARRALGDAAHRIVKTVPRRGYLLVADPGAAVADPVAPMLAPALASARAPWRRRGTLAAAAAAIIAVLAVAARSAWRAALPPPTATPAVAVLPFVETAAPGAWLGDALRIDVTSGLARLSNLSVLATRQPAPGERGDVPAGAASHLLSGSVQQDATRVRVTVYLTEAASGRVVWSERYESAAAELVSLGDEITMRTVTALQVRLVEGEQAVNRMHPKGNLRAWELATRGLRRIEMGGPRNLIDGQALFEQALAIDPDYAWARAYLAASLFLQWRLRVGADPSAVLAHAFDEATHAVETNPRLPDGHAALASVLLAMGRHNDALAAGRRAAALGSNDARTHAVLARMHLAVGDWAQAVALGHKANALFPQHPSWYWLPVAYGSVYLGRFDDAIAAADGMAQIAESPLNRRAALGAKAFALVEARRIDEARPLVDEMGALMTEPDASASGVGGVLRELMLRDPAHAERLRTALRAAGMPD